jgi:hypothetical protein
VRPTVAPTAQPAPGLSDLLGQKRTALQRSLQPSNLAELAELVDAHESRGHADKPVDNEEEEDGDGAADDGIAVRVWKLFLSSFC